MHRRQLAFVRVITIRTRACRSRRPSSGGTNVAVNKRVTSASALAALSISVGAVAQQGTPEEADTIVVTGVREALRKGLENKKESTQVLESIVAEDIGKLPDNNVVEALQRVTGVQVSNRGGGEAERHHHSRPPRHRNHLERPQRIHVERPSAAVAGHPRQPRGPDRRLQDPRGGPDRNRPGRTDRRAHPPTLRFRRLRHSRSARAATTRSSANPSTRTPACSSVTSGTRATAASAQC